MNLAVTTLVLKEMGKFVWEGREKRKTWYSILGVDAMPLSLKNLLLCKLTQPFHLLQQK